MSRGAIKQIGLFAGYLAVPLALVLAIALLALRRFDWYIIVGLIVFLAATALWAATNPEAWQRRLGRQRVSSTISGIVVMIALVGIIVLINVLSQRLTVQFDLTQNSSFTITDTTAKILDKINQPTQAIIFYNQTTTDQRQKANDLLKQYAARNDKLSIQSINLDEDPLAVQRYAVKSNPSVVFQQGQRRQDTGTIDEQNLSKALLALQNPPKRVLIVTGHQEFSPQGSQNGNSIQTAVQALTDNNYKVEIYNSVTGVSTPTSATDPSSSGAAPAGKATTLDPNTDILFIAGPRGKYSDDEKKRFDTFFKQGGKAFIAYDVTGNVDPAQSTNLNDLLASWGAKFDQGVAVETDPQRRAAQSATIVVPTANTSSPVVSNFTSQDTVIVANSSSIEKVNGSQATFTDMLKSSDSSYLKTNLSSQNIEFEQGDIRGPLILAASIQQKASLPAPTVSNTTGSATPGATTAAATTAATTPGATPGAGDSSNQLETRLVIFGSALTFSDQIIQQVPSNYTLLVNSMNFLSASGNDIVINSRPDNSQPFTVTNSQTTVAFWSSFLGIPLLILFLGLAMWWRRR